MEAVGSNQPDGPQAAFEKPSIGTGYRSASGTQSVACMYFYPFYSFDKQEGIFFPFGLINYCSLFSLVYFLLYIFFPYFVIKKCRYMLPKY